MTTKNESKKKIYTGHKTVKKCIEAMWDSLDAEKKAKFVDNGVDLDTKNLTILTRCNPSGFVETVGALAGEKVAAVCEMGFGSLMYVCCTELSRPLCQQLVESIDTEKNSINIHGRTLQITKTDFERVMGVKDGGQDIVLSSESIEDAEFTEFRKSLYGENKEINVENLKRIVTDSDKADEYFKISFVLYAISTVLCPSTSTNIDPKLIIPLRDHANIGHKNWSTFCFLQLMEGIRDFHKKKEGYIGGSILFLQLFYCDLVSQRLNCVEKCMLPIVVWSNTKTKRLVKWIIKHGGLNCSLLFDYSELSTKSKGGQYINVGPNLEKQSMDEIEPMKSKVSIMMRETMDEFKKSMDVMKEDMVASIVAEVFKSTQHPASKEVVKEKLVPEVGVTMVQVIESEGGNDIRSLDPSELDSLIVVGTRQANPPQAPVSLMPEEVGSGSQRSDCSRSPVGPCGTTQKHNTNNGSHRVLFPQFNNMEVNQISSKPNVPKNKQKVKTSKVGPFNQTRVISEMDEDILNFIFPAGQLSAEESSHIVAGYDGFLISRGDIACVQPHTPLLDDVINVMAAYMNENKNLSWFFPTYFGQQAKNNPANFSHAQWIEETRSWCSLDRFEGRLLRSCKIFIPLHDGEINHWFLVIVNTPAQQAVIYDSLIDDGARLRRLDIVVAVLRHLDRVFLTDIICFDHWFEFNEFTVINADFNPRQENIYDCGVYVIRHMQIGGRAWGFTFNSADQRVRLALEMVKHPKNQDQAYVFNNMRCKRRPTYNNSRRGVGDGDVCSNVPVSLKKKNNQTPAKKVGDGDVCSDVSESFKNPNNQTPTNKVSGKRKVVAHKVHEDHVPNGVDNENPGKARYKPRRR